MKLKYEVKVITLWILAFLFIILAGIFASDTSITLILAVLCMAILGKTEKIINEYEE